ncbi:tRNA dihydrouridine synthase [Candidatus Leptofilum sp.]|uniref:tRNA dihydrouridine synthase n=1 Tax=Candidatus Leptofilum sp. TaxID=3241576 RepID=UPI003B5C1070
MPTPNFHVRDLPIYGDTILSPMAAYSDVPFRAICRQFGAAMNYTEFVPTEALLCKPNPLWRRLDVHPAGEQPMVFQIFGNDAHTILRAAQRIVDWGADIIDINMGCSAPQISKKGAGVGMMRQPKLVAETFRLLSRHLNVPVTGKLRLGWDEANQNYLEIAKIMADNGAALVALHGRTRSQKYRGQADWDAIAKLKQAVNVPVLGNGDVRTVADIDRLKAYTHCDGVMIGRAALGNPWLLGRIEREQLTFGEITAVLRQHLYEALTYYGTTVGLQNMNRHLKKYLSGLALKPFLRGFRNVETVPAFEDLLCEMETAVPSHLPIAKLRKIPHFPLPVGAKL